MVERASHSEVSPSPPTVASTPASAPVSDVLGNFRQGTTPAEARVVPYSPALDSLRAFAAGAVLLHHYLPKVGPVAYGLIGVRLFFVLSGFLITSILLEARAAAEGLGRDRSKVMLAFYARRFLRIFPIYYLTIAISLVLNLEPAREIAGWLLTYTLNFFIALNYNWPDHFSHFWSLAVEEQFYLCWPWVILFVPRRALVPVSLAVIVLAPLFRGAVVVFEWNYIAAVIYPVALLDTLGLGALLALLLQTEPPRFQKLKAFLARWSLWAGLALFVPLELCSRSHSTVAKTFYTALYDIGLGLIFYWLVFRCWSGGKGFTASVMKWRPLVQMGKISYGIYVYHAFVPALMIWLFQKLHWNYPPEGVIRFVLLCAISIGLAALSWRLYEKPLNNLKRFFRYT